MKRITPNGALIKDLRSRLETGSLQKQFCDDVRISERKLREIENENSPIGIDFLDRIAKRLNVHRDEIVFSMDGPRLVEAHKEPIANTNASRTKIYPRFDYDLAKATMDAGVLFKEAIRAEIVDCRISVSLTAETEKYAQELFSELTALSRETRGYLNDATILDEMEFRARVRSLLVWLKGNDIWVYQTSHIKTLPETFTVPPDGSAWTSQFRYIVCLGPAGEYGEDSIRVDVDNGQPQEISDEIPFFTEAENSN